MSKFRFNTLSHDRHLRGLVGEMFARVIAVAAMLSPLEAAADCCGGGGGSISSLSGMPAIEGFARNTRPQLRIYPGEREEKVEIFNVRTGDLIGMVSFGGPLGQVPFGITAPDTNGDPVIFKTSNLTTGFSGFSAFSSSGGTGSSTQGGGGESAGGGENCPDPDPEPECDKPYDSTSVGIEEGEEELGDDNCKPPGDGTADGKTSDAADDSGGGTAGSPSNPEPPTSGSTTSTEVPAPAPGLFDALLANLKETKGGANVSISPGESAPPIQFEARHIQALNLSSPTFRKYFRTDAFGKKDITATPPAPGVNYRTYAMTDALGQQRFSAIAGTGAGEEGFQSAQGNGYITNLEYGGQGVWNLTFTNPADKSDIEGAFGSPQLITSPQGTITAWYQTIGGGGESVKPFMKWQFKDVTEGDGPKTLEIRQIRLRPLSSGKSPRANEFKPPVHVRYWQTEDSLGRHTFMLNVGSSIITEIIDRDEQTPEGTIVVRGEITQRGIGADAIREGWIMQSGPGFDAQPTALPSPYSDIKVVNFGGAGKTVWKWTTDGMWEVKTVTPSIDAVVRRETTLRPWGSATTPLLASEENAHCTVEEINGIPTGEVRTKIVSMGGKEISRTVNTRSVVGSPGSSVFEFAESQARFPAGPLSTPTVSYIQRYSNRIEHPGAGRIRIQQKEDRTFTDITYEAGALHIDSDGEISIIIPEVPFEPDEYLARRVTTRRTLPDKREEMDVQIEDALGRVFLETQYATINGVDKLLASTRTSYYGQTSQISKIERRKPGAPWKTEVELVDVGTDPKIYEFDEGGAKTTKSDFFHSGEEIRYDHPRLIVREAIPAAGDLPAVPEQRIEIVYNSSGQVSSHTVKSGPAVLKQEVRTYTSSGELESVTLNNQIVTAYRYIAEGLGGRKTMEYRYSVGEEPAPDNLVFESTTDWRNEAISQTGPGVVEEHRTETALGVGRLQRIINHGPIGNPLVSKWTEVDGLDQTAGEKISVPNGEWRMWSYDAYGNKTSERVGNFEVFSWSYNPDGSVTRNTNATPYQPRVESTDTKYIMDEGTSWVSRTSGESESQTKLDSFGANQISVERFRKQGSGWTIITRTSDTASKAVVETAIRPGVTSPAVEKYRGGFLAWEQPHSAVPPTKYTLDGLGRAVQIDKDGGANTQTIEYDPIFGKPSLSTTWGTEGSHVVSLEYYGPTERGPGEVPGMIKKQSTNGLETFYRWNPRGQIVAVWGATSPVKHDYDDAGRLWKMHTYRTDPGTDPAAWPVGDVTEWVYYPGTMALQTKKDAAGKGPLYEYDPRGWLSKRTLARSFGGGPLFASYEHNYLGELYATSYNDNGVTPHVSISRDAKGRLVGVLDGTGNWTYSYDANGRLTAETGDGDDDSIIYRVEESTGRRVGYGYWHRTPESGSWITWGGVGYDPLTGRINGVNTPEGWISQSYDLNTGRPSTASFAGIHNWRGYDDVGRLKYTTTSASIPTADPTLARSYTIDEFGERSQMFDEDGDHWDYSRNARREVILGKKARGTTSLPTYRLSYTIDAAGNRSHTSVDSVAISFRTYNALNQPNNNAGNNSYYVYIRGEADPAATLTVNGATVTGRNGKDFGYRLSAFMGGGLAAWYAATVTETKNGQAPTETFGHVFVPPTTPTNIYDADGNLTQDDRWNYTWDAENRLIKQEARWQGASAIVEMPILSIEYKYDANWRRVEKKVSTWNASTSSFQQTKRTKYIYDGWNLIAEWEAKPTDLKLVRTHHWGIDLSNTLGGASGVGGLVLTRHHTPDGETTSFVPAYDGAGNVLALYDTVTGKRAAEYEYGAFGELLRSTGAAAKENGFLWSTKIRDEETGNVAYEFRYYSPSIGRWINRDPVGERGGVNLFKFCNNDPVQTVDAFGAYCVDVRLNPATPEDAKPEFSKAPRGLEKDTWGWVEPDVQINCRCEPGQCIIKCDVKATMKIKINSDWRGVNEAYAKRTGGPPQTPPEIFGHEQRHIQNIYALIKKEIEGPIQRESGPSKDCENNARKLKERYDAIWKDISANELKHKSGDPVRGAPYPPLPGSKYVPPADPPNP